MLFLSSFHQRVVQKNGHGEREREEPNTAFGQFFWGGGRRGSEKQVCFSSPIFSFFFYLHSTVSAVSAVSAASAVSAVRAD